MAGPVATKTWTHINIDAPWGIGPAVHPISGCASGGEAQTTGRQMLFNLVQALKASPGSWEVLSSCGYEEGGAPWVYDLSDNWTDASWIRFSSLSKRSWIVLRNTAISSEGEGFQMLIDCDNSCIVDTIHWWISPSAGFSTVGFDEENPPTASDQYNIRNNERWTNLGLAYQTKGMSVFKTDDGACTRIYGHSAHATYISFFFERLSNANPAMVIPYYVLPGLVPNNTNLYANAYTRSSWNGVDGVACSFTSEGYGAGTLVESGPYEKADAFGNRLCTPVGITTISDSILPGFLGRVDDLWLVNENLPDGAYYPDDGSRQFVVMGNLLQPSDGSLVHVG